VKRTLSPTYNPAEATFDFPIHLSAVDRRGLGVLECVVWDKDLLMKKEYLGEIGLGVEDWFPLGKGVKEEERRYRFGETEVRHFYYLFFVNNISKQIPCAM
jgi:hypothetical protein